jgi:hypothetical protein
LSWEYQAVCDKGGCPGDARALRWVGIQMAVVKGSKQLRMVVVPYRRWRTITVVGAILAIFVLTAMAAYRYGYYQTLSRHGDALAERDSLLRQVEELDGRNMQLQQQIVNLDQSTSVDKEALTSVQGTIVSLREQISQLEEDVLFYKQILSPENAETGLVIGQLDLIQTGTDRTIRYRLELKQQGNNERAISGHVNVNILGQQDGEEISIPLRALSASIAGLDIKLQFRYFQNIEGELSIPAGFEPQKVQILAVAQGENAKTVQKSFGWLVQN